MRNITKTRKINFVNRLRVVMLLLEVRPLKGVFSKIQIKKTHYPNAGWSALFKAYFLNPDFSPAHTYKDILAVYKSKMRQSFD